MVAGPTEVAPTKVCQVPGSENITLKVSIALESPNLDSHPRLGSSLGAIFRTHREILTERSREDCDSRKALGDA